MTVESGQAPRLVDSSSVGAQIFAAGAGEEDDRFMLQSHNQSELAKGLQVRGQERGGVGRGLDGQRSQSERPGVSGKERSEKKK